MTHRRRMILASVLLAALALPAAGRNVDLVTVPPRDGVQLTIYNSEDLTLVRETRRLTLKKGLNRIQYAWAGTLIDPTSLHIRPVDHEREVELLDTTFLHDKPQHCIWNIESGYEGQVRFEVTYFTSGISWSADYVLVSDPDEEEMSFDGYVQISNHSGEEYEGAQVRLVVGVVNLVEKIQELARRGIPVPPQPGAEYASLRKQVMLGSIADYDGKLRVKDDEAPAEIIKEGLSEYFIYTIDGEQSVPDGWSKRMLSFQARKVRFETLYRLRPHQWGPRPIKFFTLVNDAEHKLGTTPLPDGIVRTFRDNGRDGLSFLGEQSIRYVPIKEDIELKLDTDDEVVHERTAWSVTRSGFTFRHRNVVAWDETQTISEELRNYRGKPIRVEVQHVIAGDAEVTAEMARLHDYHTLEFTMDVRPRDTLHWQYTILWHCGERNSQERIRLK